MNRIKFKEFVALQRGYDLPRSQMIDGEYPVVGSTSIIGFHNEFKQNPPGVVTGRSGSLGEVQYITRKYWPHNTSLWVKDFKGNLPRYVYYLFKTLPLANYNAGAGVPTLNRNHLDNLDICVHNLPNQRKVSAILSAYDDLIENNARRIQILEEMVQRIYREWFVDFRFPGHEKVKFVSSELGMIPKDWEIATVGDVIECIESGSRPKGGIDPNQKGVPSVGAENILGLGQYEFDKEKYVSDEFYRNMRRGMIKRGDILLYKDGAKIGRKSMFRDGFPHDVCCINEHVFILRTNIRCSQNYLYFYLDRPDITQMIISLNANAAQPGINQTGVKGLPVLLPTKELIDLFDEYANPLLALLFNLAKKNRLLKKKRDVLLPKLMSGDLDVSELEFAAQEQEA